MLALLLIFTSVFLGEKHITNGQSVYLSLRGTGIANGSNVLITDIGETENALLCFTNLTFCCDSEFNRTGEWFFPNGSAVPIKIRSDGLYRNRGPRVVRLNRKNGTQSPTGLYCCRVPDATLRNKTACANIISTLTAPENFTALSTNSREIQFSWTLPSHVGADPTRMNINYNLTCRPNTFGVTSVAMTYSEAGSHTLGGFRPATEYNCSVFAFTGIRSGPFTSVNVTTVNDSSLFQLRLTGVNNCSQWVINTDKDRDQKLEDVTATVQASIQNLCQCGLLRDRITDGMFRWFPASPQGAVTYRAMIHGTASTNSSQLVSHIERWIEGGTNVIIRQALLRVNGSCRDTTTTPGDGGDGPLSNPNSPTTSRSNNNNSFVLIGVALVIGIIAGASITSLIAIITCCILRHRAHRKKNTHSSPGKRIEATSPMFESGTGHGEMSLHLHVNNPVIAHEPTNPMEHEYADLSEIGSKQQAQAQASRGGQAKTGGYELTQCLAYGAVAHH